MAVKPENTFIRAVHNKFGASAPYYEKNNNPYHSGTPDVFYSGVKGDLWVEYKYQSVPLTKKKALSLDLSARQREWLNNRYGEGRNVAVILGAPDGALIFRDLEWNSPSVHGTPLTPSQVASWIVGQTGQECKTCLDLLTQFIS